MNLIPLLEYRRAITSESRGSDAKDAREVSLFSGFCPFCHLPAHVLKSGWDFRQTYQEDRLAVCLRCGWWSFEADNTGDMEFEPLHFSARAILQTFFISEDDIGSLELAKHITSHPDYLSNLPPAKLEQLAAAIYRDVLGYTVEFVSYGRPDGGVDVLCTREDHGLRALQVKRYKRPIEVAQIREFIGAMFLGGHRSGVFLTSSNYRAGCSEAVRMADSLGIHIDLVDGERLLEFIDVLASQRTKTINCSYWGAVGYGSSTRLASPLTIRRIADAPLYDPANLAYG